MILETARNHADGSQPKSAADHLLLSTCDQIIRRKIPNLLRLYLNPFVAQACVALSEMVHELWPGSRSQGARPSFLANSGEEALSGAIKLARYTLNSRRPCSESSRQLSESVDGIRTSVCLVDDGDWFGSFASTPVTLTEANGATRTVDIEYLPDVKVMTARAFIELADAEKSAFGILVLSPSATDSRSPVASSLRDAVRAFTVHENNLLIACVDVDRFQDGVRTDEATLIPDIVVFDESFTMRQVPFGAFCSRAELYRPWTGGKMSTFHSTTYQPNTVSTMHFLKCLQVHSERFSRQLSPLLSPLLINTDLLLDTYRSLFSPGLARMIKVAGFASEDVTASGHYIKVGSKRCFDGVGGVACSLRGHNPEQWVAEMEELSSVPACSVKAEVSQRLYSLTGLQHHVPAVSGGSAAELALKLALAAQAPQGLIVALTGGFGGKTLLALAGTSKPFYREGLDPLYPGVLYVDPFAENAAEQFRKVAEENPIAVIQLELIQGVGGVREIPAEVLQCLSDIRERTGALVFVDEIQTGMYRTGSFVRSAAIGFKPDLLTIGKGTSDMMVPFAMTLYSDRVASLLQQKASNLPEKICSGYQYSTGYRTLLNTLRRCEQEDTAACVISAGECFRRHLAEALKGVRSVRAVRCFGLLIGIELNCDRSNLKRLGMRPEQLYLLQMMQHRSMPVLMGFCQYEPHILKLTPPLTISEEEVIQVCRTIADVLKTSLWQQLSAGLGALMRGRT